LSFSCSVLFGSFDTKPTETYESLDSKKLHEAADRALDHYLKPPTPKDTKRKPSTIYHVGEKVDNETLLVNACESLASASVMLGEFAGLMDMPHRNMMLGIQSVVMLGELAVNRVLDNLDPQG